MLVTDKVEERYGSEEDRAKLAEMWPKIRVLD